MTPPIAGFAFANERSETGFLRNLTLEMKLVLRALDPVVRDGKVFLHLMPAATAREIQDLFQDRWTEGRVSIFHYGGHASSEELWLEGERGGNESFFAEGLARFLQVQQGLNLVFLNACSTAEQAKLLLDRSIPAVIATSRKIPDDLATAFSEAFYRGLASGASIEEAFQEADGLMIAKKGQSAFQASGTRSLYWDDEQESSLDLPWRLYLKQEARWFPAQWRLVHRQLDKEKISGPRTPSLEAGRVLEKHLIYENLGHGTIGTVYRAQHLESKEDRALKVTYQVLDGFELFEQLMVDGFKAMQQLDHPNIARVLEMGRLEEQGMPQLWISMEMLKGKRLDQVEMKGSADQVLALGLDLCKGLEAAHQVEFVNAKGQPSRGVFHGNLMTKKVFLDEFGNARMIDFLFTNLARLDGIQLHQPIEAINSLRQMRMSEYFAPELLAGEGAVNALTDIYSVGAILLERYTGKPIDQWKFSSEKDLNEQTDRLLGSSSKPLVRAIYRATLPNPDERWQSAEEMADSIAPAIGILRRLVRRFGRRATTKRQGGGNV